MRLQVAKWGNSLAVRLPAVVTRQLGVVEGDTLEAELTATGELRIASAQTAFDKQKFLVALKKLHRAMPVTKSVIEMMRNEARY